MEFCVKSKMDVCSNKLKLCIRFKGRKLTIEIERIHMKLMHKHLNIKLMSA